MEEVLFYTVIRYLTAEELESVKDVLQKSKILFVVNEHGPHSRYSSQYYEVKVSAHHFEAARAVVKGKEKEIFSKRTKCTKCKGVEYTVVRKNFWQRVFYVGTVLVQCNRCKNKFSI